MPAHKLVMAVPVAKMALFDYPEYWAECYGSAPFLPVSRAEMDERDR